MNSIKLRTIYLYLVKKELQDLIEWAIKFTQLNLHWQMLSKEDSIIINDAEIFLVPMFCAMMHFAMQSMIIKFTTYVEFQLE